MRAWGAVRRGAGGGAAADRSRLGVLVQRRPLALLVRRLDLVQSFVQRFQCELSAKVDICVV